MQENFKEINNLTKEIIENTDKKLNAISKIEIKYPGTFKELLRIRWNDKNSKNKNKDFKVLITDLDFAKLCLDNKFLYMYYENYEIKSENLISFGGLDFEIIKEEKVQEFKVGDRVKHIGEEKHLTGRTGEVLEVINDTCLVHFDLYTQIVCNKKILKKVEDRPQVKTFELKKGMKIVRKDNEKIYFYTQTVNGIIHATDEVQYAIYHFEKDWIDWEATKKLNEYPEENKEFPNEKESEPKPKEYMIFNPKGNVPRKIHNSLESAEKEVVRLLNIQSNQEFYVVEIVKKAKGSITVSWSE